MKLSDLKFDKRNANKGTERGRKALDKSLSELGAGRSVLIDKHGNIIAGNKTIEQAGRLGMKDIEVVKSDGSKIIAVQRTDLDLETDAKARKLAVADNRIGQLDLEWDVEQLLRDHEDIDLSDFWDQAELNELLKVADVSIVDDTQDEQNAADLMAKADEIEVRVKPGDLWQFGEHRLLCGDSTKREDVERVMNGEKADLVFTDPPYGVRAVKRNQVGGGGPTKFRGTVGASNYVPCNVYDEIEGDETTEAAQKSYKVCVEIGFRNFIIWGGNYFTDFLFSSPCWIIWDKENTGNFADVEMAWTSFKKGSRLYRWLWNGLSRKGNREDELKTRVHPTQKPVGLFSEILTDFEADIIFDPFLGSGTTLIACEKLGRRGRGIEISPKYCQVIINRWELYTGKKAELIGNE